MDHKRKGFQNGRSDLVISNTKSSGVLSDVLDNVTDFMGEPSAQSMALFVILPGSIQDILFGQSKDEGLVH